MVRQWRSAGKRAFDFNRYIELGAFHLGRGCPQRDSSFPGFCDTGRKHVTGIQADSERGFHENNRFCRSEPRNSRTIGQVDCHRGADLRDDCRHGYFQVRQHGAGNRQPGRAYEADFAHDLVREGRQLFHHGQLRGITELCGQLFGGSDLDCEVMMLVARREAFGSSAQSTSEVISEFQPLLTSVGEVVANGIERPTR